MPRKVKPVVLEGHMCRDSYSGCMIIDAPDAGRLVDVIEDDFRFASKGSLLGLRPDETCKVRVTIERIDQ